MNYVLDAGPMIAFLDDEPTIARMLDGNATAQFGVKLVQKVGG